MKSSFLASVYLWSNHAPLREAVEKCLTEQSLKVETKTDKETDYRLLLISLNQHENLSTLVLDSLESLKNYSGKTCLVIASDSQANKNITNEIQSLRPSLFKDKSLNLRLIQTLDLYDSASPQPVSQFQTWLCQTAADRKVTVSSSGKNLYYPTAVSDFCQLVSKSLFVTNTSGEVFTALSEELTDLEIAYLIKKSLEKRDFNLDLDLKGKTNPAEAELKDLSVETQALLNWLPKKVLAGEIDQLLDHCQIISEETETTEAIPAEKPVSRPLAKLLPLIAKKHSRADQPAAPENLHQTEKRFFSRILKFSLLVSFLIVALPVILSWGLLYWGTRDTYQAYQQIRIGESEKSRRLLNRAQAVTSVGDSLYRTTAPVIALASRSTVENTGNFISVLGHGQEVLGSVLDAYSLGNQLYQGLIGKQEVDETAVTAALRVSLIALTEKLSQIQLLLGKLDLPFGYSQKIKTSDLNQQINLLKSQIALGLPLLDLTAVVTSGQTQEHYLLIFQDENELRPSGGFIAAYADLALDQGKIVGLTADSSLTLDRLIEGRIEPPALLKNLLGTSNWLFHDSNLDANFANSAAQMAWFSERFRGGSVAGIVGLNLNFFKFLLAETGPISLLDGQTVSADNLFELASNSTAAKGIDSVTALARSYSEKFLAGEIKFSALARALLKAVTYSEINLWFRDRELTHLAQAAHLTGEIIPLACHPQLAAADCRPDTLYLNEANFSVSKLNFYQKRKQTYLAEINDSGEINYHLTYDYSYPVPAPTNLAQVYKAYYQFYLPAGSRGLTISLDGKDLSAASLIQSSAPPLAKVEFSAALAINQPHQLVIKFTSPFRLDLSKPQAAYSLTYLKQPGTMTDQLSLRILYPEKLQPRTITLPLKQVSATELVFETSPISNENLGLLFKNTSL